jgi:hypothetical protein
MLNFIWPQRKKVLSNNSQNVMWFAFSNTSGESKKK